MRYLIKTSDTYRVATVAEVEALHDELLKNPNFTLTSFRYKTKYIKDKGQIVEEYQLVTAEKTFDEEREPANNIKITYETGAVQ